MEFNTGVKLIGIPIRLMLAGCAPDASPA